MLFFKSTVLAEIKAGRESIRIHGDVGDSDAQELAEAFRQAHAHKNTLKTITFTRSKVSAEGLQIITAELAKFSNLATIAFDFCFIERAGAQCIAALLKANSAVVDFTFWRNCPNEECWQELLERGGIQDNECNSWIDVFAPTLADNQNITYVDLSSGSIDDAAAQCLAQAITKNTSINQLDLSYCKISEQNMRLICQAMNANNTLQRIRATYCGDPTPHFTASGIEIYQFLQIAKDTFTDPLKCDALEGYEHFTRLTERKRIRHAMYAG